MSPARFAPSPQTNRRSSQSPLTPDPPPALSSQRGVGLNQLIGPRPSPDIFFSSLFFLRVSSWPLSAIEDVLDRCSLVGD